MEVLWKWTHYEKALHHGILRAESVALLVASDEVDKPFPRRVGDTCEAISRLNSNLVVGWLPERQRLVICTRNEMANINDKLSLQMTFPQKKASLIDPV